MPFDIILSVVLHILIHAHILTIEKVLKRPYEASSWYKAQQSCINDNATLLSGIKQTEVCTDDTWYWIGLSRTAVYEGEESTDLLIDTL